MAYRAMVRWAAPAALALLVMLPRLASPQFGLLDDGLTLQTGRATLDRWTSVLALIPDTGRFFPAYWLVYGGIVGVAGARPLAFFIFNVLLFTVLLVMLARVVRVGGGSPGQAAVAVVLFAGCGPAIEAFYTLSKAEPLQVMWIGVSLLAVAIAAGNQRGRRRTGAVAVGGIALVLAYTTKETTAALIVVSLGWLAIEWWSTDTQPRWARFAKTYAALSVAAGAIFLVLRARYATLPLAEGWYTRAYSVQLETLGPAVFRIGAWIVRDFAYLLPLLVAAIVVVRTGSRPRRAMLYAAVWMVAWLAVFAPWPATFEYYLLPFAFGAAVFAGSVIATLWRLRGGGERLATRRLAWAALAMTGVLWLPGIVNALADGRVQLAVDRANADLVDFCAGLPSNSRVALNTTSAVEYLFELPLHLAEIKRRPDLVVHHVVTPRADTPAPTDVFVATPTAANQPRPTVRVAVYESDIRVDTPRLHELLRGGGELVYSNERRVRVVEVGLHRLLCGIARRPFLDPSYCPHDRGVLHAGIFTYRWLVHRLPRVGRQTAAR